MASDRWHYSAYTTDGVASATAVSAAFPADFSTPALYAVAAATWAARTADCYSSN